MRPLLRASEFCRHPLSDKSRCHTVRIKLSDHREPPTTDHCVNDETEEDPFTVFTSTSFLRNACWISGRIVELQVSSNNDAKQTSLVLLPVRLRHLPQRSSKQQQLDELEDDSLPVIYISPLVALNLRILTPGERLGVDLVGSVREWTGQPRYYEYSDGSTTTDRGRSFAGAFLESPPIAHSVTLRCWGRPVVPLSLTGRRRERSDDPRVIKSGSETADITSSREDAETSWPLPCEGRILVPNCIMTVGDSGSGEVFFYEIVKVRLTNANLEKDWKGIALSTKQTKYDLEAPRPGSPSPQLLPILNGRETDSLKKQHLVPPHPDLDRLVSALNYPSTTPVERILHMVGSEDEHCVQELVSTAAGLVGRRCLHVTGGLAAYAFLCGASIANGGLADKLTGLNLAIQQAKQHAPVVLHIRLDKEFSADSQDRQDEESRIWTLLKGELKVLGALNQTYPLPPVVVILSTSSELPSDGPIRQRMVLEPIPVSHPDKAYAIYLWNRANRNPCLDFESFNGEDLLRILKGRSAKEIVLLREQLEKEIAPRISDKQASNLVDPLLILRQISKKLDDERRHHSRTGRIPTVAWEDVGGLGHVRSEIMDTIELPLLHPHLVPAGGRTGILLYGPPGCGKTLVAKAVATECNLPFLSIKGPELLGSFVGESEKNVRGVFERARHLASQNQPPASVLFFDELDSLAPRRGDNPSGGNVMDRVVATLFAELDRRSKDCTVFCIAATNRPDLLDPALLRPGRLDRLVYLGVSSDHVPVLVTHLRKLRLDGDVEDIAAAVVKELPANFTGADLSSIASIALLGATERLCIEVDNELMRRRRYGEPELSIDDVLDSWDEDQLEPIVTLTDLLEAARTVIPSVSEEELQRYQTLRDQFSNV